MKSKLKIYLSISIFLIVISIFSLFFILDKEKTNIRNNYDSSEASFSVYHSLSPTGKALFEQQSKNFKKEVPERLVALDNLTIGCFGPQTLDKFSSETKNLGGQCCGALKKIESYDLQLDALKEFIEYNGELKFIPIDPYNISIDVAKKLRNWDEEIILDKSQLFTYNKAIEISHHGGPCCCKCWKWYVMSGLAKKLISEYEWNENQIAELWDLSSSCGHDEDTNMVSHYDKKDERHH
jgi:hypothetical protein